MDFDIELSSAFALLGQGRLTDAEKKLLALAAGRQASSPEKEGRLHYGLGLAFFQQGKNEEARQQFSYACELFKNLPGSAKALAMTALARAELACGATEQSVKTGREALELLRRSMAKDDPRLAPSLFALSFGEYESKHFGEAEALLREALALWKTQRGPESLEVSTCLNDLGRICEETNRISEGIALHKECLEIRQKKLGVHPETAFSLGNLGTALASAGQWQQAADMLERALACYAQCGRTDGDSIDGLKLNLELCRKALACR
ncbi:MAG: tetratricopeptide repeat protein [Mailhella sp.]|nr:tetratricopeptide repeat protein [Mailhella sp.]